jgi:DNA-binding LytR/AlgR family response regulator
VDKIVVFNNNSKMFFLNIDNILYFEKNLRHVLVNLNTIPEVIYLNTSMKNLYSFLNEQKLLGIYLYRPHYSYIVNIRYINITWVCT